jgi:hypothetical protein
LALDPAIDPDFVIRRIDPEIPMLAGQRARAERGHDRVELTTDPRDLGFGDAVQAQRLHQVVDFAGRDAVHVRLLDHREEGVLGAPARLQQ